MIFMQEFLKQWAFSLVMAWKFLNFDAPRYCPAMPRKLRLRLFLVILGHLAPLGTTGHGGEPHFAWRTLGV